MTSRYEGLPMVLIEAKSYEMACVSFDCPNGPSEIICDGSDGYVIPMGNDSMFAKRVIELMENKNKSTKFSQNAIKDVEMRFSKVVIINQWIAFLIRSRINENTSCYSTCLDRKWCS